jgi:hypothetical protein
MPSKYDNIICRREVIERIVELRGMIRDDEAGDDDRAELKTLEALRFEAEGSPDWKSGGALISDSYFSQYAKELARDVCELSDDWPFGYIDWEAAAEALKTDYKAVDFDGETYWIRA